MPLGRDPWKMTAETGIHDWRNQAQTYAHSHQYCFYHMIIRNKIPEKVGQKFCVMRKTKFLTDQFNQNIQPSINCKICEQIGVKNT